MEGKKTNFVSYLDDDGQQKDVWVEVLKEDINFISFKYRDEIITIPWHRVLKVKKKEDSDGN